MSITPLKIATERANLPFIIAGPCSAESPKQLMETALALKAIGVEYLRAGIWKPRTKPGSFEGVGETALGWLKEVKEETGLKVAIEIANPNHIDIALKWEVDLLWIGARTTTNPFMVQEIADKLSEEIKKGREELTLLIKNPVNPDLELWIGAIERIANSGVKEIGAIHRGFNCYHKGAMRNTPHWNIPMELKRRFPSITLLCDPSHMGGDKELVSPIAKRALEIGYDGLMIESHIDPSSALSDSKQQLTPTELEQLLNSVVLRSKSAGETLLEDLRGEIDRIDSDILELISQRMAVVRDIGKVKAEKEISILQPHRYDTMVTERVKMAPTLKVESAFIKKILEAIHQESVRQQLQLKENLTNLNQNKK